MSEIMMRPCGGSWSYCDGDCDSCRKAGYTTSNSTVATKTNADHIRAMSDEELADLLCTADWCETCDQMREEGTCKAMELDGPLNKHCVSAALRWLRQPYKEET